MGKKGGGRVRVKQLGPKAPTGGLNPLADLAIPPEEMICLPPKMDSSINHFFPMNETFSMQFKHFPCIWPTYIDKSKTGKEGRRIGKEHAVEGPSVHEISEVLQSVGVRHVIQPYKGYSRDTESRWYNQGRILYDLEQLNSKGALEEVVVEVGDVPNLEAENMTQKQVWKEIAKRIPFMPGRIRRLAEEKRAEEEAKKKAREAKILAANAAKANKAKASSGSNKKKGKKKR